MALGLFNHVQALLLHKETAKSQNRNSDGASTEPWCLSMLFFGLSEHLGNMEFVHEQLRRKVLDPNPSCNNLGIGWACP